MRKSIYIITPFVGNINNAASRRINSFIESLLAEGHSISVIYSHSIDANSHIKKIPTFFKLRNNNSRLTFRALFEVLWGFEVFIRIIFITKKSTIIGSSPPYLSMLLYGLVSNFRKKIIFDIRDLYPQVFYLLNLIDKESFFYSVLEVYTNFIYRNSMALITVTESLKLEILKKNNHKKVLVIRNGFDRRIQNFVKQKTLEKELRIAFHGTIGIAQNIDLLIELIDSLKNEKNIKFIIVGKGPRANEIMECSGNVEYYYDLPYDQMFELISNCHIGLSLRNDGYIGESALPVKIFEYAGLGLPIISTPKRSEVSKLKNEGHFIKMCNNKKNEIIEAIYEINKYYKEKTFTNISQSLNLTREVENQKLIKLLNEI